MTINYDSCFVQKKGERRLKSPISPCRNPYYGKKY